MDIVDDQGTEQVRSPAAAGALLAELRTSLPASSILDRKEDLHPYECDGLTAYRQLPLAVANPPRRPSASRIGTSSERSLTVRSAP